MMITDQFTALGDPLRWQILHLLVQYDGSLYVDELVEHINRLTGGDYRQSTVSHHLGILRHAGLIAAVSDSCYHFYHVRLDTLAEVEQALAALRTQVEVKV